MQIESVWVIRGVSSSAPSRSDRLGHRCRPQSSGTAITRRTLCVRVVEHEQPESSSLPPLSLSRRRRKSKFVAPLTRCASSRTSPRCDRRPRDCTSRTLSPPAHSAVPVGRQQRRRVTVVGPLGNEANGKPLDSEISCTSGFTCSISRYTCGVWPIEYECADVPSISYVIGRSGGLSSSARCALSPPPSALLRPSTIAVTPHARHTTERHCTPVHHILHPHRN